jgi:NADH pyrophosphatase NudC (nudix superfamily)
MKEVYIKLVYSYSVFCPHCGTHAECDNKDHMRVCEECNISFRVWKYRVCVATSKQIKQ